jgi:DNA-binding NarL/FixJ family response regulator
MSISIPTDVFTSFAEGDMLRETVQAGAIGYQLKDARRDDLVSAVRAVAEGQPWFHDLTEGTVKGYVSTVFEKIGVEDRTQAALYFTRASTTSPAAR